MRVDIVGAGPAGLMAAEVAAEAGHRVRVFDQRRSPARKLVLAGRGGLNITHSEPLETLLDRYGPEREHLEAAIRAFPPEALRAWCADLGHPTFVGTSGRVFPNEMRAVPLLRSWLGRLDALDVERCTGYRWVGWDGATTLRFETPGGPVTSQPDVTVLALGGASWPLVGGDGSWVELLAERGVAIRPLAPANCGVRVDWSPHLRDRFAGTPLKNVAVMVDGHAVRGEPVVTVEGLEGGPIYAQSRRIRDRLADGPTTVSIDLFPDLESTALERRLADRRPGDSVANWLRRGGLSPIAMSLLREVTGNEMPGDAGSVARLAKSVPIVVRGTVDIDRAISSAGGIEWSELDDDFAIERLRNVVAVGEMLDWEAPTGGYLLQACFSTARWAANALG